MVVDLNQAVDIGNYLNHLHLNPVKNITETLLGKYKDAVNLSQETSSVDLLQSSRNQRYERNLY
jgi:hypothetical protein